MRSELRRKMRERKRAEGLQRPILTLRLQTFPKKFIRILKYGIYPGVPLRMREYIRARNKLSGHHRI